MSTLLRQPVFVIEQRKVAFEMDTNYEILDGNGGMIGTVRQVEQSLARKVFRLVSKADEYLSHKFDIADRDGAVLMRVERPAKFLKSRLIVSEPGGREIGEIAQLNSFGKVRFGLISGGKPIGELRGRSIRDRSFDILDLREKHVGRVTKKFEGLKGLLATEDRYAVTLDSELDGPLRKLAIAAGVGLDLALHQSGAE